jgi:alkylation response protein AidB-like acyl-CoA dehydrogenase
LNLTLSHDQIALRDAYTEVLSAHCSMERVRAAEASGFDPRLWARLVDMGLTSMGLPGSADGGGADLLDLAVVARECGRRLAPVPFIEAIVAGRLLAAVHHVDLLDGVADGSVVPTLLLKPMTAGAPAPVVPVGSVADVLVWLDGHQLVLARRGDTSRSACAPNLGSQPLVGWNSSDWPERTVIAVEGASDAYAVALDEWRVLMAAALDGLRAQALDIGLAYVRQRTAFGVPIGSFQAIKHRLADVSVAGEGAELLVNEAAWAAASDPRRAAMLAAYALVFTQRAAFQTCREVLQFHGGYGVTLEYDIQLYFRRAKAWPLAIGDLAHEEQRAAVLTFSNTS